MNLSPVTGPAKKESPLEDFLSREEKTLDANELRLSAVCEMYAKKAEELLESARQKERALRPQAEEALNSIVKPWLISFAKSENLARLSRVLQENGVHRLRLAPPMRYNWPERVFGSEPLENPSNFRDEAKSAVENGEPIEHQLEAWSPKSLWNAILMFQPDAEHEVYISRWPEGGGGRAFAMGADRYHIHFEPDDLRISSTPLPESVWIGLADHIKSGKAEEWLVKEAERMIEQVRQRA